MYPLKRCKHVGSHSSFSHYSNTNISRNCKQYKLYKTVVNIYGYQGALAHFYLQSKVTLSDRILEQLLTGFPRQEVIDILNSQKNLSIMRMNQTVSVPSTLPVSSRALTTV